MGAHLAEHEDSPISPGFWNGGAKEVFHLKLWSRAQNSHCPSACCFVRQTHLQMLLKSGNPSSFWETMQREGRFIGNANLLQYLCHHLNVSLALSPQENNNLRSKDNFSLVILPYSEDSIWGMTYSCEKRSKCMARREVGLTWSISKSGPPVLTFASMAPRTLCWTSATVNAKAMRPLPA